MWITFAIMWKTLYYVAPIAVWVLLYCKRIRKQSPAYTMEIPENYRMQKLVVDYIESITDEVPDMGISRINLLKPGSEKSKAIAITLHRLTSKN